MTVILNHLGAAHAEMLIESGSYDDTAPWSFSAEDGDKLLGPSGNDWSNFGKFHLGEDTSATVNTKARYKYPFGKDGKVFGAALRAVRSRASQQNDTAIFDEAGRLLDLIDKKKSDGGADNDRFAQRGTRILNLRAQADSSAEIDFFGVVGGSWWDDGGITKEQFAAALNNLPAGCKDVTLRISSPGGDVFDGRAIANMIKQHPANFTANIIAEASSAASIITMACESIHMAEGAIMLVHRCYTIAAGNADEFDAVAADLRVIDGEAVATYAARTGMSPDAILALMKENRYMNAAECKAKGFCDTIDGPAPKQLAGLCIAAMNVDRQKLGVPALPVAQQLSPRRAAALAAVKRMRLAA